MKQFRKIACIVLAASAVVVLAAALLVSPLAKRYIVRNGPELIGRRVTMDKLRFNLFSGRLHVTDLRIAGADDSTTFFTLEDLEVRLRLLPLLTRSFEVRRIALRRPDLKIYQRGNAFNFDDMVEKFRGDTTQIAQQTPSEPWEIGIYDISIARGHILYKDLLLDATWGFNDLDLQIPGVYFSREKTDVGVVLNFAEGGSLETELAYRVETSDYDLGIRLRDFTLAGLLPYLRQSLDVGNVEGRLTADMHLRGNTNHMLDLRTEGTATLADFVLSDGSDRPVLTADTLHVDLAEGRLQPFTCRFNRVYASGIKGLFELQADGNNNLAALMKPSPAGAAGSEQLAGTAAAADSTGTGSVAATSVPTPEPGKLTVADLEIRRSSVTLRDVSLEEPFEYRISDIRMRSRDFDPDTRNKLTINARMQKTGSARLIWDGSLNDLDNQSITLMLSNLDLRDFSPYCEHYTAYPITHGNVSFHSQNVIRNRYLDGTNHLDAFEPKVDRKRKDIEPEMKIPLKLGLYVLKDKKGHVKMDLPVKGSLDSPEFSYRKIVMKAIGNVLLKVVTAPFSFLGGKGGNLDHIDIDPLQYDFSAEQYASFDKLAQSIREKPDMKIVLSQRIDYDRTLASLARNNLRMSYYNHLRAREDTAQRRRPLTMLEYEKIQALDFKSEAVIAFADSMLRLRGIRPEGLNAQAKALRLHAEDAARQLPRILALRDSALMRYMVSTHGLSSAAFQVQAVDSTAQRAYKGSDRYTIGLEAEGETVEVAAASQSEEKDAADDGTSAAEVSETGGPLPSQTAAGSAE